MGFYVQSKSIKLLRKCRRTSWEEGQGNELLGATPNMWPIQGDTVRLDSLELKKKSACMTDKGMKRKKLWAGGNGLEVTYLTEVWFLKYVVSRGWDVAQGVRGCLCQMEPELDRVFSMQVSPAEPGCVPACNPSTGGKNRRFLELLAGWWLSGKGFRFKEEPYLKGKRVCEKPDILLWPPHACIRAAPSKINKMKTWNFQNCLSKGLERWLGSLNANCFARGQCSVLSPTAGRVHHLPLQLQGT